VSALTRTGQSASVESGIEGNVRYGFTNTFSLGFRMWTTDFEWTDGASVNGVSFDGLFNLNDSASAVRYAIASRALFLFSDRTLEGQGLLVDGVAWLPDFRVFKPFVAVGGGVGEDLDPDPEDREFIVVATGHAGIALNLTDNLSARLEGASVTEFNAPENGKGVRWWIVPSLSLAWRF